MFTVLVRSPDFALSNYEFDVLWTELGLGRMPHPIQVPPTGSGVLVEEVRRELTDRGLLVAGRLADADLAALLRLLDKHSVAVDLIGDVGYPVRALAATDGRTGVLATLAGGELWLTRTDELASAIMGLLPEVSPLAAESPVPALDSIAGLGTVTRELTMTCSAAGRFGFSSAHRPAMTWFDADGNRYLVEHESAQLRIGPIDHARLERRIATTLSTMG